MTFDKVLVVGSGVMGPGIALSFAQGGVTVAFTDTEKKTPWRREKGPSRRPWSCLWTRDSSNPRTSPSSWDASSLPMT